MRKDDKFLMIEKSHQVMRFEELITRLRKGVNFTLHLTLIFILGQ